MKGIKTLSSNRSTVVKKPNIQSFSISLRVVNSGILGVNLKIKNNSGGLSIH
jgi:hypothetical protein